MDDQLPMDVEQQVSEQQEEQVPEKEEPMIRSKVKFAALILVVFLIPVMGFLTIGMAAEPQELAVGKIQTLEDGRLEIPLSTSSSGLAFCMVGQQEKDAVLTLKPRLSLVSFLHSDGSVQVQTKKPADQLTAVFLEGTENEPPRQIWPQQ